jgi:hypothetical protein
MDNIVIFLAFSGFFSYQVLQDGPNRHTDFYFVFSRIGGQRKSCSSI